MEVMHMNEQTQLADISPVSNHPIGVWMSRRARSGDERLNRRARETMSKFGEASKAGQFHRGVMSGPIQKATYGLFPEQESDKGRRY